MLPYAMLLMLRAPDKRRCRRLDDAALCCYARRARFGLLLIIITRARAMRVYAIFADALTLISIAAAIAYCRHAAAAMMPLSAAVTPCHTLFSLLRYCHAEPLLRH